jgi:hypothetical protein
MYGWLTGLMFSSCCFGALIWISIIQSRTSLFKAYKNYDQLFDAFPSTMNLLGESARWQIAVMVLTPLELLFTSIAKLLVLFRMLDFASTYENDAARRRWLLARKVAVSVVALGIAVGLVGGILSSLEYQKVLVHLKDADAAYADNILEALGFFKKAIGSFQVGNARLGMQEFSEALIQMMIFLTFAASGILCFRRITSVLRNSFVRKNAILSPVERMRQQIVVTVVVVFSTSLLRTAYACFVAISNFGQTIFEGLTTCEDYGNSLDFCDIRCYSW